MAINFEPTGVQKLSREEKLKLVTWLFSLESSDLSALAQKQLTKAFPTAPKEMLRTAEFHLYVDGKGAALDWIADLALFLQSPSAEPPCLGNAFHLLYHLYNWWQFQELLPEGTQGLRDLVNDAKQFIAEGDPDAAIGALQMIEQSLDGNLDYPKIGR